MRTPLLATFRDALCRSAAPGGSGRRGRAPRPCRCPDLGLQTRTASAGSGALKGVAATSASNAWAAGSTGTGKALVKRWNGRTSTHRLQMEHNRKEDSDDQ